MSLQSGSHGAKIGVESASVAIRTDDGFALVPGVWVDTVQTREGPESESYALWEFRTRDSVFGEQKKFFSWLVPMVSADVQIVEACGYDHGAREEAAAATQRRSKEAARLSGLASLTPLTPSQTVLEADSSYRVRATWEWTGRVKRDPAEAARDDRPACEGVGVGGSVEQTFEFATAPPHVPEPSAVVAAPDAGSADINQSTFDPRDLSTYVSKTPSF